MSVRARLIVIILFVAVVPLSVSALTALRVHQRAFDRNVTELFQRTAEQEAIRLAARLDGIARSLRSLTAQTIPWDALSAEERTAALWLVYRNDPDIAVALLLDEQHRQLGPAAFVADASAREEPGHPRVSALLVSELIRRAESSHAATSEVRWHDPFLAAGHPEPVVPLVIELPAGDPGHRWSILVGLGSRTLCQTSLGATDMDRLLVDSRGWLVCPIPATQAAVPASPGVAERIRQGPSVGIYRDATGTELLAANHRLPNGWHVFVQKPAHAAFASNRELRQQAACWIALSLVIALSAGLYLSRSISVPVDRLVTGARELGRGNLQHRLHMTDQDDLGRLGRAFDQMCDEIAARDAEIRAWNDQLKRRVEERTRDLEQAQERLLHSEKAAAVASLSAGVAAEVNEPLTGVLGITQLLLSRARQDPHRGRDADLLGSVEQGALRIREIVKRVQYLAQRQPKSQFRPIRVDDLLQATLALVGAQLPTERVDLTFEQVDALPLVSGNFAQLQQAMLQVLSNAVNAIGDKMGRIVVSALPQPAGMVEISVVDTGSGIAPADLDRVFEPFFTAGEAATGAGLGLSIARRIIEEHRGTIRAENAPTGGTILRITLPVSE